MNKYVLEGGAPSISVESIHMNPKIHRIALSGTPFNGNIKPTFNPCFVLLGLHIQVPKQDEHCQRKRCKNHRERNPDKKDETKLRLFKSWEIKGVGGNVVKMSTWECPRCEKRVRRKLDSWRESPK